MKVLFGKFYNVPLPSQPEEVAEMQHEEGEDSDNDSISGSFEEVFPAAIEETSVVEIVKIPQFTVETVEETPHAVSSDSSKNSSDHEDSTSEG